jgi:hypothetical protein
MNWRDWLKWTLGWPLPRRFYTGPKELVIPLRGHADYHEMQRFLDDGWHIHHFESERLRRGILRPAAVILWHPWTGKNPRPMTAALARPAVPASD